MLQKGQSDSLKLLGELNIEFTGNACEKETQNQIDIFFSQGSQWLILVEP